MKNYSRAHFRVSVNHPVMFAGVPFIGEGQLTNLTVGGCSLECGWELPLGASVRLRLLLPDHSTSLPIDIAAVRWSNHTHAGLEFVSLPEQSQRRLHSFVLEEFVKALEVKQRQEPHTQQTRNPVESE